MNKKNITKNYKELIGRIESENIYDGRGVFDLYECKGCHHKKITTYKDKGVTPSIIKCNICNGFMYHIKTYSSVPEDIHVIEWVRPTLEQAYHLKDNQLEHLFNGGLFMKDELIGLVGHVYE